MGLIRKGSIKQKLMRISMLTTFVALLLTSVLLIANEVIAFRQSLMERMGVMAKIIGTSSTAALMFNDQKTAEETINALKSAKNINCAFLYNRKGDVLAQYIQDVSAGDCRAHPGGPDGYHWGIDHLNILQHIHLDNESIGTLYIQSDLKELYRLILWYLITVFMVILLSIAIAFALLSRLQKIITRPLSEMADVMLTISGEKNYSVRVAIQSQDEVGILGEGFNEMLSQIQNRDTELELHRKHLQDLVTQRTEELARTNIDLQKELADRKLAEKKIQASLREKETMLKEIHHRVKNNLQVISSLLNMQSSYLQNERAKEALQASMARVRTMALIHTQLYQTQDFTRVDFGLFIQDLIGNISQSYGRVVSPVEIHVDAGEIDLSIDTSIPCGLILNELIANALKHAFPERKEGEINIRMRSEESRVVLTVQDNGIGFPKSIDFTNVKSLGLELVNILVGQMNGKIEMQVDGGTKWTVTFPVKDEREWRNG